MRQVIASNEAQQRYIDDGKQDKNIDKSGMIFGYLKVLRKDENNHLNYICYCNACGRECSIPNAKLTLSPKGNSSCGCLSKFKGWLKKDEKYFDEIDTAEKAYWLGFIGADGTLDKQNTLVIRLKEEDISHLVKFKQAIKSNVEVKSIPIMAKYPGKEKTETTCCKIAITSKYMANVLKTYGIIPDKTKHFNLNFNLIPEEFHRDVIRGLLDGDGTFGIYYSKRAPNTMKVNIGFSGSKEIIKNIRDFFEKNNVGTHWKEYYKTDTFGELRNASIKDFGDILNFIYEDAKIYLDRKYIRYFELTKQYYYYINNKKH